MMPEDPLEPLAKAIMANPRFKACVRHYIESHMAWRKQIGIHSLMANSYGRALLIIYVCLLHFGAASERPEDGATFGRIWDIVNQRKDYGKRSLRTFLGIGTLVGVFKKVRGNEDSRVYSYVPSAETERHFRDYLTRAFECIDIMDDGGRAAEAIANPAFLRPALRKFCLPILDNGLLFAEIDSQVERIFGLNGGMPILQALTHAEILGEPRPRPSDLARQFKVSNSQARAVIEEINAFCPTEGGENGSTSRTAFDHFKLFLSRELAAYIKYYFEEEGRFIAAAQISVAA